MNTKTAAASQGAQRAARVARPAPRPQPMRGMANWNRPKWNVQAKDLAGGAEAPPQGQAHGKGIAAQGHGQSQGLQ